MALLNKLGEIVKSAAEKTEELTKTLGEKAEAALEIQRLNSQVNKERSKISDTHKKIGEILWAKFEAGEEIPEEFKEHCTAISEALTKIDEHKVAIAKIKATAFAGEEPKTSCPSCGAQVTLNSKFCGECGGKMPVHEPEPVEEEAAPLTETVDETKAETAEVVDTPAETEKQKPKHNCYKKNQSIWTGFLSVQDFTYIFYRNRNLSIRVADKFDIIVIFQAFSRHDDLDPSIGFDLH